MPRINWLGHRQRHEIGIRTETPVLNTFLLLFVLITCKIVLLNELTGSIREPEAKYLDVR